MLGRLRRGLQARERAGQPVRVGLVGAGQMGLGLAAVLGRMPGMRLSAVADLAPERAAAAFQQAGVRPGEIVQAITAAEGRRALAQGRRVIATAGGLVAELPVDVVVDATGIPLAAAVTAAQAIEAGHHIVLLTVEADVPLKPGPAGGRGRRGVHGGRRGRAGRDQGAGGVRRVPGFRGHLRGEG